MIHVLFVPGMFGSTVEHVIRNFTAEYTPTKASIDRYGAMHSYRKEAHPTDSNTLNQIFNSLSPTSITTPIYPVVEWELSDLVKQRPKEFSPDNHCILMYAPDLRAAELNMLFQYHKIAIGLDFGLDIFFAGADLLAVTQWNSEYQSFDDMEPWEFREWVSLFYVQWVQKWIESQHQVDAYFLKIANTELLASPKNIFQHIIEFCNLTQTLDLTEFSNKWINAQQYILKEFEMLDEIVYNTVSNQAMLWKPISIIGEAIVQQRLRSQGYEIRCDGLNVFPTDSQTLYDLLEKV